jgi:hypothetical protein
MGRIGTRIVYFFFSQRDLEEEGDLLGVVLFDERRRVDFFGCCARL